MLAMAWKTCVALSLLAFGAESLSSNTLVADDKPPMCKIWCSKGGDEVALNNCKSKNKQCGGCDICSKPETPTEVEGVPCEGNCALGASVKCEETVNNCAEAVVDGVYSWDKYKVAPIALTPTCSDSVWVEIDLGKPTTFDQIKLVAPNRPFCGRKIQLKNPGSDWVTVFDAGEGDSDGKLTVKFDEQTAQIVRVYSSKSKKNNYMHLFGIEVYDTGR